MAKPKSKRERSPYMDQLVKVRGEIRALSAGIESHLNVHAAWWKFTERAADARRLADLFLACAELQAAHNAWERVEEQSTEPNPRGHWIVLRNGCETVDYGTSFTDAGTRMAKAADTIEELLRIRYGKARMIQRTGNAASVYIDVLADDGSGSLLQREWLELQNIGN